MKIYTCLMLILLSKCVACFLWLYDHKVHSLAVAFKQLSSGLASKVKNKFIFIKYTTWSFYNICFSIEQKMGNYETKSLDWNNGSSSTKTQGLFLFLLPLIFTNCCTFWLRFYRSITLWHFTRNPTLPLNSYQCLRSLLWLAIGAAY